MSYRAPSYLHGKAKGMEDPCVRCDNLPQCAEDGRLCKVGREWEVAYKIAREEGLVRHCATCKKTLPYHSWIEVRCTLDNEDTTLSYCYNCFVRNMDVYVKIQNTRIVERYYDGKPHYRAYGNHP